MQAILAVGGLVIAIGLLYMDYQNKEKQKAGVDNAPPNGRGGGAFPQPDRVAPVDPSYPNPSYPKPSYPKPPPAPPSPTPEDELPPCHDLAKVLRNLEGQLRDKGLTAEEIMDSIGNLTPLILESSREKGNVRERGR